MTDSTRATDLPRRPLGADPSRRRLPPRELQVALLVAEGLKDAEIGQRLGLTASTVSNYVRRIQLRLGLESGAELVAWVNARRNRDDVSVRPLQRGESSR
jgi:DNA-binding NarL/FixJ family response regulator